MAVEVTAKGLRPASLRFRPDWIDEQAGFHEIGATVVIARVLEAQIVALLREAGYDVVAVAELDDLVGSSDRVVFAVAATEDRAVVTNNVKDYRPLAAECLAQGRTHGGLILLPSNRTRARAAVATLVGAIGKVLQDHPDGLAGSDRWIGPSK